jgi:hypothetical protein
VERISMVTVVATVENSTHDAILLNIWRKTWWIEEYKKQGS